MRKVLVLSFCLLFALSSIALARQAPKGSVEKQKAMQKESLLDLDRSMDEQEMFSAAQPGTTWICPPNNLTYTFDSGPSCVADGWTAHDVTEQTGCYWHVADATELDGGDFGGLIVLEGLQSLWCGAMPDAASSTLCGYAALPGYGNGWDQNWVFKCISVPDTEEVYISYDVIWDSEPGYDYTYLEYATKSTCDSLTSIDVVMGTDWQEVTNYTGYDGPFTVTDTIPAGHAGSILIRFHFLSDGAWSDQDGLWNTDGAIIIDSLTVAAQYSGTYDYEDFEDEAPGDQQTTDGDWQCATLTGYGDFSGIYPALTILQEDPCYTNLTCVWAFINGTDVNYACGSHPEQDAVPYVNDRDQYIVDEMWSPAENITGTGTQWNLQFDVYRDLYVPDLLFYIWHVRSIDAAGCPGQWKDRNFVYYGANKDWLRGAIQPVGDLISPTAVKVQVALGVQDMTPFWYIIYGTGDCHSHSPLFDNVELYRVATAGPQWSARDIDLFNDTFPENGQLTGTARIDMALDRLPGENPAILPGDSAKVLVSDPVSGLGTDPYTGFGASAYFYMYRDPETKPIATTKVEEDGFRWPLVDSVLCDGHKWYQFRMDTCFTEPNGIPRTGNVPDAFCIDINDHYFTNGDTLWFFFGAVNTIGEWTWWSQGSGTVPTMHRACEAPMEIQILPSGYCNQDEGGLGDILYVDNFSGRGAQNYFDTAFEMLSLTDKVDRFDKRGPSSLVGNSVCNRATVTQLQHYYRKIIWNSGDLSSGTVGDGTDEKANDYAVLYQFLDQHTNANGAGIYFSGDDLAAELNGMTTTGAQQFKGVYMPHALVTGNHNTIHRISPLGIGEGTGTGTPPSYGIFDHGAPFGVDTLVVYGGCPIINDFDVVAPSGGSTLEMCYDPANPADDSNPAVIAYAVNNALGNPVRTVLSGFSFHYIRDDRPQGIPDRADHLRDIIEYLQNIVDEPVPVTPTDRYTNNLYQNYPNPFNPSTTIKYSVKEKAHVSLKIYNVAGQLVRTLVDSDMNAGAYAETWNGRSNSGNPVSSGVYFYKLVTKNFSMTKKMVLLK